MEITLDQLLASRENRHEKQMALLSDHPSLTLVCLTVIMPGAVKRNSHSLIVANAALTAVLECFRTTLVDVEVRDLATGYEAYVLTSLSNNDAKRLACKIEDEHPLGRLFDLDIITASGEPLARTSIGLSPRKCLLCDNEARFCMRNHSHTQAEIQQAIDMMIEQYVQ
ncbi:MAG: citrate lyase holo-[acyl-carrier protein] synthase [Muribaculaceae bacterium]|nr:citrate lyase holo-[acyl-carrier protein] synthase [Muribaculaceae bacterium]